LDLLAEYQKRLKFETSNELIRGDPEAAGGLAPGTTVGQTSGLPLEFGHFSLDSEIFSRHKSGP
jgi:hypothetical protein